MKVNKPGTAGVDEFLYFRFHASLDDIFGTINIHLCKTASTNSRDRIGGVPCSIAHIRDREEVRQCERQHLLP